MIKFLDLKAVNQRYAEQIRVAVDRVLESGWYLLGAELEQYEVEYAAYCKTVHAVGVASGLDALILILRAYGLGPGDEIIIPANTYIATVLAVTNCGADPVFVEPDPCTHLIDPEKIEEKISKRTKAVMPVHLYGQLCNMKVICNLAGKHNLKVVEDAAQSHGAVCPEGKITADYPARAAGHSFYPSKNLGALADAGMITTNDGQLAEKIRALRNYGSCQRYYNKYLGINSRMDEMQAAILRVKLKGLDEDNVRRRRIASYYLEEIKNQKVVLPKPPVNPESHVWHLFVIRTRHRGSLQRHLEEKGIQTQIHYPVPPHKQECYAKYNGLSLPIAEQLANEVLSLPISPVIKEEDVLNIVRTINDWK
ncbi:MAG: DegT/DnrJ/EryC1/StrS family aminotransferase [Planctomycetales bacterium]|nr:DegT/DnrJ/EryC1/StrS family aminotransferase [Planctomycetales bacterium]